MIFIKKSLIQKVLSLVLVIALMLCVTQAVTADIKETEIQLTTEQQDEISGNAKGDFFIQGCHWPEIPYTVSVRNYLGSYSSSISSVMTKWNGINTSSGGDMINFVLSSSGNNDICWGWELESDVLADTDVYTTALEIGSFNIAINQNMPFSSGVSMNYYNIDSVIMHELGHALGIFHCHEKYETSCSSSTCRYNVMNPILDKGQSRLTIQSYDRNAYRNIYE